MSQSNNDNMKKYNAYSSSVEALFIEADWPAPSHVRTLISTRKGGISKPPYDSMNLGLHVGDNEQDVLENRRSLNQLLPAEPCWLNQTHSTRVIAANKQNNNEADACFTTQNYTVCVVMTADCLPILLTNHSGSIVAAVHAGWRGLCDGIIDNTVQALQTLPENIIAWLGPAIGPDAFEVGSEVYQIFCNQPAHSGAAFTAISGNKYLANIYHLAKERLRYLGVQQIYGGHFCTVLDREHFFSYRRDHRTGRMASCIWLDID